MRTLALILPGLAAIAASACATYQPAPVTPAAIAERQRESRIDSETIRSELKRIAPAYEWDGAEWNELTLFAAALTINPELSTARARLDAFAAEVAAARVRPGPTMTLTAEYAFNPTESSPWLFGIASEFLAFNGGRRGRVRAAEAARRAAEFDYLGAVWNVRMTIRRAADAYNVAIREAAIAAELVAIRQRQFNAVRRQVDAGETSRLELDNVRGGLAAAESAKISANASVESARIDIAAAVGAAPSFLDSQTISPAIPDLPEKLAATEDEKLAALNTRPEILKAVADYDQAEIALQSAVAAQYPEIRVGPGYQWERGLSKLPATLALNFPSMDLNAAAIHAAQARRLEAGRQLEAAIASVTSSIARAEAAYKSAWVALDAMRRRTLPAARSIAQQADREFQLGAIDSGEWAASQAGLAAARLAEISAMRTALDARTALEDALRRPLDGPELEIGAVRAPFGGAD